jgi:hypothetical protein
MIEGVRGTRRAYEHTVSETSKQSDGAKHSARRVNARVNAAMTQRRIASGHLQSGLHAGTALLRFVPKSITRNSSPHETSVQNKHRQLVGLCSKRFERTSRRVARSNCPLSRLRPCRFIALHASRSSGGPQFGSSSCKLDLNLVPLKLPTSFSVMHEADALCGNARRSGGRALSFKKYIPLSAVGTCPAKIRVATTCERIRYL